VKGYGINSNLRKISDMSSSEIIETVAAKQQVFNTAVEASTMILNIDDVFMKDLIDNTPCHIDGQFMPTRTVEKLTITLSKKD